MVRLLFPPLCLSMATCLLLWATTGGSFWIWLILGWIAAAPLTLLWALWMVRAPKKGLRQTGGRSYQAQR